MKKVFAVFCAMMLTPMFSANAWVGGPFSNNSYFGASGDDGVYEATASGINGIGLFRIVVGNEFQGSQDIATAATNNTVLIPDGQGGTIAITIQIPGTNSGNMIFGAIGTSSNVWFYEGVSYLFGQTVGTVNSALGIAQAAGTAANTATANANTVIISSGFSARLVRTGDAVIATAFEGVGSATPSNTGVEFSFSVFGTKVSNNIFFGI